MKKVGKIMENTHHESFDFSWYSKLSCQSFLIFHHIFMLIALKKVSLNHSSFQIYHPKFILLYDVVSDLIEI